MQDTRCSIPDLQTKLESNKLHVALFNHVFIYSISQILDLKLNFEIELTAMNSKITDHLYKSK